MTDFPDFYGPMTKILNFIIKKKKRENFLIIFKK